MCEQSQPAFSHFHRRRCKGKRPITSCNERSGEEATISGLLWSKIKIPAINFNKSRHKIKVSQRDVGVCLSPFNTNPWQRVAVRVGPNFVIVFRIVVAFHVSRGEKYPGKEPKTQHPLTVVDPHTPKSSKQMCTRAKKNWNVCSDSYLELYVSVGVVQSALRGLCSGLQDALKERREVVSVALTWFIVCETGPQERLQRTTVPCFQVIHCGVINKFRSEISIKAGPTYFFLPALTCCHSSPETMTYRTHLQCLCLRPGPAVWPLWLHPTCPQAGDARCQLHAFNAVAWAHFHRLTSPSHHVGLSSSEIFHESLVWSDICDSQSDVDSEERWDWSQNPFERQARKFRKQKAIIEQKTFFLVAVKAIKFY